MAYAVDAPQSRHRVITPSDTALANINCLYIAVAGDLVIEDDKGVTVTYAAVPVGVFPFMPAKVKTGTTATVVAWG